MIEDTLYNTTLERGVSRLAESIEVYMNDTDGIPYIEILPVQWSLYAKTRALAKEVINNYSFTLGNHLYAVSRALAECDRAWLETSLMSLKLILKIRHQLYDSETQQ